MAWEEYTKLEAPTDKPMDACPCCGSDVDLWQNQPRPDAPASKVVMCSNGEAFGPQDGIANEGCPLYMPADGHYKATIREAIAYWNEYAKALGRMQRENRWRRHSVLRTNPHGVSE